MAAVEGSMNRSVRPPARLMPIDKSFHTNRVSPLNLQSGTKQKSSCKQQAPVITGQSEHFNPEILVTEAEDETFGDGQKRKTKDTLQRFTLLGTPYKKKDSYDGSMANEKQSFIKKRLWTMLEPNDNKLSLKLFGSKRGILKEKRRLKAAGFFIIHPCSSFR